MVNNMAIAPKLQLKQGQSLVMTPQLQQAIKLLQLSNIELAAYAVSYTHLTLPTTPYV